MLWEEEEEEDKKRGEEVYLGMRMAGGHCKLLLQRAIVTCGIMSRYLMEMQRKKKTWTGKQQLKCQYLVS
jgi:hypothetical protein